MAANQNEHTHTVTEAEADMLEKIRVTQGLPDLDAAASWLIKSRLARTMRLTTPNKRGRALYAVRTQPIERRRPL